MSMMRRWSLGVFLLAAVGAAHAEKEADCSGCRDNPLLSRYPGSVLTGYIQKAFDEQVYITDGGNNGGGDQVPKTTTAQGKRTVLYYRSPEGRSSLEVFENYKEALTKAGFNTLWTCSGEDACGSQFRFNAVDKMRLRFENNVEARQGMLGNEPRYIYAKLERPQGDVYVGLLADEVGNSTDRAGVFIAVTEAKPMDTGMVTVDASALDKALMSDGKATLYGIYFDSDKADIKPKSKTQLDEISKVLQQHPDLKLRITGHTDNKGDDAYNQKLSQRRAEAIMTALVKNYGVATGRLSAQGFGASSPVTSNDTEEGRAKNRRVELVKQ